MPNKNRELELWRRVVLFLCQAKGDCSRLMPQELSHSPFPLPLQCVGRGYIVRQVYVVRIKAVSCTCFCLCKVSRVGLLTGIGCVLVLATSLLILMSFSSPFKWFCGWSALRNSSLGSWSHAYKKWGTQRPLCLGARRAPVSTKGRHLGGPWCVGKSLYNPRQQGYRDSSK